MALTGAAFLACVMLGQVHASVVPERLLPGQPARHLLTVHAPADAGVRLLDGTSDADPTAHLVEVVPLDTPSGSARWRFEVPLVAWEEGPGWTEPVPVEVDGDTLIVPPAPYRVVLPLPGVAEELPPAAPVEPAGEPWRRGIPWILGIALLGGLLGRMTVTESPGKSDRRLGVRESSDGAGPPRDPVRTPPGDPGRRIVALATEARTHPRIRRVGVGRAQTSQEAVKAVTTAEPALAGALAQLLGAADAVKFAGAEVTAEEAYSLERRWREALRG